MPKIINTGIWYRCGGRGRPNQASAPHQIKKVKTEEKGSINTNINNNNND
jgi:hypothetical protein